MTINNPTAAQVPQLRSLWQEAFGDTEEFLNIFTAKAMSADRCRCITVDGEVAAALYWFDCLHMGKKIAYLYAVATAKKHRGKGLCRDLMENTHRWLQAHGYVGAILVPQSEALVALYEKMGYETCTQIREFVCGPVLDLCTLHRIDRDAYARLRRQLLPAGGVVQEQENLDFLEAQAQFYEGTNFVLAAYREKDVLHGVELLGDISAAPGIVGALGCTQGKFRCPGQGIPFAMYRHLTQSGLPAPTYFGLAFD